MYLRYKLLYILFIFLTGSILAQSQETVIESDSLITGNEIQLFQADSVPLPLVDSIAPILSDTIPPFPLDSLVGFVPDSIAPFETDSMLMPADTVRTTSSALDARVDYQAADSIIMTMSSGNWAYLFGDADVKYQQIELQAENIEIEMDSSIVFAKFGLDSIGSEFGYPLFVDGGEQYEAKTMRYNFKTKKGYISDVITQQGEGYVTSRQTKKLEDNILNMVNGRYTTCDDHEHPHFYIHMTKAKVRPHKNIVTGPVYLVVEDVPLPLGLPFAFFPFSDSYSSGIIFPSFGDESTRGFFIRDGGYYFAINDYVDLALRGDIYTKGSWGMSARSAYRKRYKYSGNFDTKYVVTKTGDKGLPDYSLSKDFMITWTHSQDAKANPYRTFSANVNFRTSSYNRNELNELFNSSATNNTKSSSISLSQRFPNSPFSISGTMTINQTARDSTVSLTLPNMTITMSRIYPLKRKVRVGKERWYEKISLDYNSTLTNQITTKENLLFKSNLIKDWNNGMQHNLKSSATFSLFNFINITPNFSYTEKWVTTKAEQEYDIQQNKLVPRDTTYGFYRLYNYTASVSAQTTLYGFFTPLPFIPYLGKKVKTIRHRLEPNVSVNFAPDFGASRFGYYKEYHYINNNGDEMVTNYSPFSSQHNPYGPPGRGRTGSLSFGFNNNVEAKIYSDRDSTGERKISLIDNLSISTSYNMVADSFKWSDISTQLRIKITKSYTLNLNMNWDTYTYKYDARNNRLNRVNVTRWQAGKGLGRLRGTGTSFSYTFNNDTFKKLFGGKVDPNAPPTNDIDPDRLGMDNEFTDPLDPLANNDENNLDQGEPGGRRLRGEQQDASGEYDADGYWSNGFPWSFSVNYSLNLSYDTQNIDIIKEEYKYKLTHALSFSGSIQPTKNWRLNFNATYDFDTNKISYLTCNISRNMHCFQMTGSVIPIGPYKSYSFTIAVSSQLLRDLKYDKHSNYRDGQNWY